MSTPNPFLLSHGAQPRACPELIGFFFFCVFHNGISANMQVITAIYLNCRPDLRDEWLSGNEVDDLTEAQVIVGSWERFSPVLTVPPGARTRAQTPCQIL